MITEKQQQQLKTAVHTVVDYPKKGIMFRDVTGILDDAEAFSLTISLLKEKFVNKGFTKVVGTEARGFLFGAPLALALGVGFVPVRKPKKITKSNVCPRLPVRIRHRYVRDSSRCFNG
jgi:adenine phosphoribosyltransferase